MNSSETVPAPIVFNQSPKIATLGKDFFVFYGLGNGSSNRVCATLYNSSLNEWSTAHMNYGQSFPALANNGKIKTILVGSSVFCVYEQSASALAIMETTSPTATSFKTSYSSMVNINDYALYTDGSYLFLVTNEAGKIYSQRLNGTGFDNKMQINSSAGQSPNSPVANTDSKVVAMLQNNLLHVIYVASTGLVDAFQLASNHWTFTTIERYGSGYKGLQLLQFQEQLMLVSTGKMGTIDVYQYYPSVPNYWSSQYSSDNNVPAAASEAQAGVNQFGFFISYVDTQGRIQCVYCLNDATYYQVQIGGTGASQFFVPQAPNALGPIGVGMYGPFYHACYLGANNVVYDVFWAYSWNGTQLYPTPPSAELNLTEIPATDAKMIEAV